MNFAVAYVSFIQVSMVKAYFRHMNFRHMRLYSRTTGA